MKILHYDVFKTSDEVEKELGAAFVPFVELLKPTITSPSTACTPRKTAA